MLSTVNRWKYLAAMALIGDGLVAVIQPRHGARTWMVGPRPWRAAMQKLEERPGLTRLLGAVQAGAVICWVLMHDHAGTEQLKLD